MSSTVDQPVPGDTAASQQVSDQSAAIEARAVTAGYVGQPVIHDIDLRVEPGEVVALLGANGAGKTTTLLTLCGELRPMDGEVLVSAVPTRAPLHRRARDELSFVTQERSVFMGLSTRDNLRVAGVDVGAVVELFPELQRCLSRRAGLLSGGEQQMLTLGRALARRRPLVIADELSLGLAPLVVRRLLDVIRQDAETNGTAVLIVEQHVRKVLEYADRAYVMRDGRIQIDGPAAAIRSRMTEIEQHYLTSRG